LFLPESWCAPTREARRRRDGARIPEDVTFRTKPQIAAELIRDVAALGQVVLDWVVGDSEYGRAGVPATVVWVGAVDPKKFDAAKAGGPPLPSLHSSEFAPDREPTIRTGVKTVTLAAMELLARP